MPGFVTCGPNEALVISGCCHSKPYLMPGGRVFVWPWLQKIQKISLNTMTLTIESPNVHTKNGVPISLTGISQVKISGNNADKLLSACENFLNKTEAEIIKIVQETLEGHQREVMAKMTVEKIYVDRKDFAKQVYQIASSDLADMGLVVVSYTVKDIQDEQDYLKALGLAQTAKVKADAEIGEIEEYKECKIKELNSEREHQLAKLRNEAQIAKAQHEFNLKKAEFDISISQERAKSDLANDLQKELGQIALIKENIEIETQRDFKEINQKNKDIKQLLLESNIKKRVDKECDRTKKIADAEFKRIELEGETDSEIIKIYGEAQAESTKKVAKAYCEIMAQEASAFDEFQRAAKHQMLIDTLPKIAGEICNPISECKKITMISQGDSEIGFNKIVTEILDSVTKIYTTVNNLSNAAGNESYFSRTEQLAHQTAAASSEKRVSSRASSYTTSFLGRS